MAAQYDEQPRGAIDVVILGGGYAGQMAAARLAQKRLGLRITVVDRSPVFVERIRLHQVAAGDRLRERRMEDVLPRGVGFVRGAVEAWDVARRRIEVATAAGQRETLSYDFIVYALGSCVDRSFVEGVAEHAHALDGLDEAKQIHARIEALVRAEGGRVLVVGGGLTGIEAACEIAERHPKLRVTLATRGSLGEAFSAAGAIHLRATLARLGVAIREGVRIVQLRAGSAAVADDGGAGATGSDDRATAATARRAADRARVTSIDFDVCLWAGGFTAAPLARAAGLAVNARGQVVVDEDLRPAGHGEIFVVGDAADVHAAAGEPLRMACATALPMGVHAAEQLAAVVRGRAPAPLRFAYAVRCVSLGRRDGLLQSVDSRDRPVARVVTGRLGARLKELVCTLTVWSLRAESRWRLPLYRWPQPKRDGARLVEAQSYSTARGASS